jgi:UDP-N-acetylglucosamine 2-epimerase (non-hydrolysing)
VKLLHVVGARPNFAKVAPVHRACAAAGLDQVLVHTGQHYDAAMSQVFLTDLGLPPPDVNLAVGSGSHAEQTARIMIALEPVLMAERPDWVVVYGDVNSTVAATLVAAKLPLPVAHVEAGLRSFDRTMPEEVNRIVTDQLASLLFTPSEDGDLNLRREGVSGQIHRVGNVMIDTLIRALPDALARPAAGRPERFALVTMHRPANVDDPAKLAALMASLTRISAKVPVIFPVHPRTRQRLGNAPLPAALQLVEPLGYLDFLALERHAQLVITDSGGVQEETTWLQVPCLTLRPNTERPITVEVGSNLLVGDDLQRLEAEVDVILGGGAKTGTIPPLWDGRAGERIAAVFAAL